MKFLTLLVFMASFNLVFAQVFEKNNVQRTMMEQNERLWFTNSKNEEINLAETQGSPYLNDSFQSGIVYIPTTEERFGYQMRYNIYNDVIEIQNSEDKSIYSVRRNSSYICAIQDKMFKYLEYTNKNNESKSGYFHEIVSGKNSLLIKYYCDYEAVKAGKPPVFHETPAKFVRQKSYFLYDEDSLMLIPTNKKKLLVIFGKNSSKVKNYIKTNKLNLKKERDLMRIISFYNSIL